MDIVNEIRSLWQRLLYLEKRATVGGGGMPTAVHASRHSEGGADEIDILDLGGYSGNAADVLKGDATWGSGGSYTDEQAQDAVGGILDDGGDIDFTYDDATPTITAILKTTSTPRVARLGIGAAADASAALKVVGELWIPLVDDGNSGTAATIDWNAGNEHLLTLTGNVTLTLSNPKDGGRYVLVLASGAGGFTVAWPAAVHWPAGTTPTITATASKYDLVTLIYLSGAGIYLASINQNYSA